jgi:hypothetical protein
MREHTWTGLEVQKVENMEEMEERDAYETQYEGPFPISRAFCLLPAAE